MVHSDAVELKGKLEKLANKDEDEAVFHRQVKEDELEYGPSSGTQDERYIDLLASVDLPASRVETLESQSIIGNTKEVYANCGIDFIEDLSSTRDWRIACTERREGSKPSSETEEEGCREDGSQVLSWLGQSVGTGPQVSAVEKLRQEKDKILLLAKQLETKEMESFRNVHLVMEGGERKSSLSIAVEGQTEAQLYLRNIVDRYPHMPSYLAHRLAIANAGRAERLRKLQFDSKCVQVPLPSNVQDNDNLELPPSDIGGDSDQGFIAVDALDKCDELPHGKGRLNEKAYDMPDYESPEPHYSSQVVGEDENDTPQRAIHEGICSASDDKSRHISMCLLEGQCRELFNEHDEPTDRLGQMLRRLASCLIDAFEPCGSPSLRGSPLLTPQKMQRFYQIFKLPVEMYAWQIIFEDEISSISRLYRSLGCQHHLVQSDEEHGLAERPDIPALTTLGFDRWVTLLIQAHPNEEFSRLQSIISDSSTSNSDDKQDGFSSMVPHRLAPQSPCYIAQDSLRKSILTHCGEDGFLPHSNNMNWNSHRQCSSSHVHGSLSSAVQDTNEKILQKTHEVIRNTHNDTCDSILLESGSSSSAIVEDDDGSSRRNMIEEVHPVNDNSISTELIAEIRRNVIRSLQENFASESHVVGRPSRAKSGPSPRAGFRSSSVNSRKSSSNSSASESHVVGRPSRAKSGPSPRANPRTSSVNSRTSSWNSTLRGSSEFDPSEQVLEFNEGEESSSEMAHNDSVSQPSDFEIPHPPTELGSTPFICEICGQQVSIEGRRAWK